MKKREALDWIALTGFLCVGITFAVVMVHFLFVVVK